MHSLTLLHIEAKRLYSGAKKDYVDSGIGRFKREEHGKQDTVAVMLGYMQQYSFSYWQNTVNKWIDDRISDSAQNPKWENQDRLEEIVISEYANYESRHSRIKEQPIIIYHFWINLCQN